MTETVKVFVVRHGRTAANAGGLLLGRADPDLDDEGRRQARDVARVLPADALVVSSPLRRCLETARAVRPEPVVDDRFVELDYGELDLTPTRDVPEATWAAWRADPGFRPPGGETLTELARRVGEGLEHWSGEALATGRDLVIVSHVSPIKAAVAWALGVGIEISWRTFVAPASVTRIAVSRRGPSLHAFNDVTHLALGPGGGG
jgi:broad specificity phosphatase PhoE